ncbi:phosphodiesterase [Vibrio sp. SM6]|uniref:Phosphoesterase n=1 Tax=Vibrio agarilyticus TaxID=2726741 RepID=A0A7X8YFF7_9VIBR|nr:phosphodiesterase [Vibrio agarilyticus]
MKLFFASDLHGSLPATQQMLAQYVASGAQHLILLGDILNHGPRNPIPDGYNPPEVAKCLNAYAHEIIAVRGNCDSEVDQMLLTFPMMMDYAWVLLATGQRLFLTHGHRYNQNNLPSLAQRDVLVHGHTHLPVAQWVENCLIFNPGSVTFPRDGHLASYGLLEDGQLKVISFSGELLGSVSLAANA